MTSTIGTRSASGITNKKKAIDTADGFAAMYDEDFVVFEYTDPILEYDVEPAHDDDAPFLTPFIIYRTAPVFPDPTKVVGIIDPVVKLGVRPIEP